ncbi:MAG: hypothetical protein CL920_14705 [Deltaproteobacteria bacterium]|nr:hypothetical protein [Deltaproteobacteria bacterium]MBU49935.1 hypothetical protein [Deltaproteobacteria bacterium]|tara:strand:- start:132 stop:632 length:501 start_codon:yes stop_codon:yes gene_type:complete
MSQDTERPTSFYTDFNVFIGMLIQEVMNAANPPSSPQMSPELAAFWKAAGDVFGLHKLTAIVRTTPELLTQLEQYTDRPLDDIRNAHSKTASHLAFTTALNDFSKVIPLGATGADLQVLYTAILENVEHQYLSHTSRQQAGILSEQDLKEELDELFLITSYKLTRV